LSKEENDQEVFGITIASFAPTGVMARGGVAKVVIRGVPIGEENMVFMLLLILFLFLRLYYI